MKKKVLSVILAAVCTMGLMAGCGAEGSKGSTQSGAKGDSYTVGISQFAEHGSLDNCREGFLEGLKEEGIEEGKNLKVDYQNAQTDTGTASTIADSFVSEKVDMICANNLKVAGAGFGVDTNKVTLLYADGTKKDLPLLLKQEVADAIIDSICY